MSLVAASSIMRRTRGSANRPLALARTAAKGVAFSWFIASSSMPPQHIFSISFQRKRSGRPHAAYPPAISQLKAEHQAASSALLLNVSLDCAEARAASACVA